MKKAVPEEGFSCRSTTLNRYRRRSCGRCGARSTRRSLVEGLLPPKTRYSKGCRSSEKTPPPLSKSTL